MAQNYLYGTGNPTWGINIPIENGFINVANGNVHMEIPIGSQPQRGSLPLTESLVYDSRIWQIVNTGSSYSFQPSSSNGWALGGSAIAGSAAEQSIVNESVSCSGSGGSQGYHEAVYTYVDMAGTTHMFAPGIYYFYGTTCPNGNTGGITNTNMASGTSYTAYAVDGSGYYLTVFNQTCSGGNTCEYDLVFDPSGNLPGTEDRNGNFITETYTEPPNTWTWTDTLGRNAFVWTNTNSTMTNLSVLTVEGAQKQYTVNWETINVHTGFGQSGVSEYSGTLTVVKSLTLPDGSTYTFNYDTGTSSGYYGELTSMTLPTGGTVSFGYQNYLDSYRNENRWLNTYSGGNGSFSLSPQVYNNNYCSGSSAVGCQEQMTVTDGNSNQVVYLLTLNNGAWNSQTDYYNNVSGSLKHILSTATNYNFTNSCPQSICGGPNGAQWVTASSTTTTLSDTGQSTQTQYTYNYPQYGKPNKVQSWDYSTPSSCTGGSTPTKETDYTYGYFVNGAAYATEVDQRDCNGNIATKTIYNYDQVTPSATSGLPNHSTNLLAVGVIMSGGASPNNTSLAALGRRGNLTSVVSGTGTTATVSSTYDDAGVKLSDTDANSQKTTYATMCSDAYLQIVTYPVVNGQSLKTTTSYDCSSGLVNSTQDMNGQQTIYSYYTSGANLGRLNTVARPDGGTTTYTYPSSIETDQSVTQSSSVSVAHESIVDTYGRSYQSVTVAPEGSIGSEITYDATGRPYSTTTPHLQGTSSSTDGTSYTYYDILGRTTKVKAPNGVTTTSNYSGNTQTVTDALSHSVKYTYDAFHRLTSVLEPNSSGTLANETDYQYNALDKITQVDQWGGAKGSTSPGDRQRLFNYSDSLGRLHSMTTPEGGTTTFSYLTSGSPCAGNVSLPCSKTDARGVTTQYTYDALNRITSKSYSNDSSGTPTSCFQYDTSAITGAGGNLLGHLTNQWTQKATAGACNSSLLTSGGYQTLRSILSYDGVGRPLSAQQCTPSNCSSTTPYALTYGYDLAGNLTYYTNGLASTPRAGSSPLTFTQAFDSAGRLQNVMSTWSDSTHPATLFSAPTYAPPGALTGALYGNGITLGRIYNNQLLPSTEIDTSNSGSGSGSIVAVPGSATVTVTGAEQSR
jgi:YD repeat-containing protein